MKGISQEVSTFLFQVRILNLLPFYADVSELVYETDLKSVGPCAHMAGMFRGIINDGELRRGERGGKLILNARCNGAHEPLLVQYSD